MITTGTMPNDWNIVPILEGLHGRPLVDVSLDQTKLVLSVLEDRNGDGNISSQGAARGFDGPNLFVYTFVTDTFKRITDDFPNVVGLSWLPDNQTVTYSDGANVFSFNLVDFVDFQLIDTLPEGIAELTWAPDGLLLAIETGELYFFDKTTNTITPISDAPAEFESNILVWSPDSEWLASTILYFKGLFLVNRNTKEIVELVEQDFFSVPVWSSDGQWLAFTQSTRRTHSSLFVWNADTRMTKFVNEANDISPAVWLPNSSSFAVGLVNENEGGLYLVDAATGMPHEMLKQDCITKLQPLSWSPDGEWLLFLAAQSDETGIYLIHRNGGEVYTVLDTGDAYEPYAVIWLP
jgi:Tol biopolymer transport system component